MATLTLNTGTNDDDWQKEEFTNDSSVGSGQLQVGGVGTSPQTDSGIGWRFDGVTLTSSDTIDDVHLNLTKSGSQWSSQEDRLTLIDEDDTGTFSSGNPPGARAIVTNIADDAHNSNHVDGTAYELPTNSTDQETLADALAEVLARGGWSSGNAVGIVDNSDEDSSRYESFARKDWEAHEAGGGDIPELVINYTAGAGGEETASVSPVTVPLSLPAVTATYVSALSASVSPITVPISTPAVSATYTSELSASVAPVAIPVVLPAVTATSDAEATASVSPVAVSLALPTVTATYVSALSAGVSPLTIPISLPAVTATFVGVYSASVSPVTVPIVLPAVTASSGADAIASVSPVTIPIVLPTVTASYASALSASVAPATITVSLPTVSASYAAQLSASVSPVGVLINLPTVTAQSGEVTAFDFDLETRSFDFDLDSRSFDFDLETRSFDYDLDGRSFDFDLQSRSFDFIMDNREA